MIKYTVWVNDDRFDVKSDKKMKLEDIATYLQCEVDEIIQIDDEWED